MNPTHDKEFQAALLRNDTMEDMTFRRDMWRIIAITLAVTLAIVMVIETCL